MSVNDKPLVWLHGEIKTPPFSLNARKVRSPFVRRVIFMDLRKKKRLEENGWKVGSVQEFLGLTAEENAYIELKLALSEI